MKPSFAITGVLLLLSPSVVAQDARVEGGRLFDVQRREFVENPGLEVRGGRIVAAGSPAATKNPEVQTLQLDDDHHVLPGLFDLHAHYNVNLFNKRRRDETTVSPVLFLANGVTSTFPAGEYDPEDMLELRRRVDRGEQIGPRIYSSGPYYGRARRGWNERMTAEEIYAEVDQWAELGARGFKAKAISEPHLRALIERAHQHGLTVTGHLGSGYRGSVNPKTAVLMGIDRVEHFLGGDQLSDRKSAYASLVNVEPEGPEFEEIVGLFIDNDVVFDATITAYGYYGDRERFYDHWTDESRFFTPFVRRHIKEHPPRQFMESFDKIFRVKQKTVRAFFEAGGTITLGTDHPSTGEYLAGFSIHREIEVMVASGIPPGAVLQMATLNGARALGVSDQLGEIAPGKLADLVVIKGDPIADIKRTRNVEWVMKAGRIFSSEDLLKSVEGKLGPADKDEMKDW